MSVQKILGKFIDSYQQKGASDKQFAIQGGHERES